MAAFTSVAAGIGLAATAGSTTMSFLQAGKQKQAQRQAESDADQAMQAARKQLETNFYDKLSIQKEPYELQREALLSQGAQAIQAGVESERGAAATAGRIQMAQQEGQAGIRSAMGQELSNLEKLSAQEDSRLRDANVQLDLGEVAGAQLAAANAQELAAQSTQQGLQGIQSIGQQAVSYIPLFSKTKQNSVAPEAPWLNQMNNSNNYNFASLSKLAQPNQPPNFATLGQVNNTIPGAVQNPYSQQPWNQKPWNQNPFTVIP